jgi:hypothetical protein
MQGWTGGLVVGLIVAAGAGLTHHFTGGLVESAPARVGLDIGVGGLLGAIAGALVLKGK